METKICSKCGESKEIDCFWMDKRKNDGLRAACITCSKECSNDASPEYYAWKAMNRRCRNPQSPDYFRYGARGISVCAEWVDDFRPFFEHIGPRPGGEYSLDRINNNGNYEPGNVRWATIQQQNYNRRVNRFITFKGKTMCMAEAAREHGLHPACLKGRLDNGWDVARALLTPRIGQSRSK
jgi:hypothetical protein